MASPNSFPLPPSYDAEATLFSTMSLPAQYPGVARWLFAHNETPIHPSSPQLSPQTFQTSPALQLTHHFASPNEAFTQFQVVLLPSATIEGHLVGYAFTMCIELPSPCHYNTSIHPFAAASSDATELRGRFVYAPPSNLLIFIHAITPEVSGIIQIRRLDPLSRQRIFVSVPNFSYSHYNLPNKPLNVMSMVEFLSSPPPNDPDTSVDQFNFLNDMLQLPSLDDNIPLPTHPTFLSDNLDAPKPFPEQQSLVSASAFDMSSIATVLHTLGDSLSGTFYSPNACRDELVNGTFQRTVRCVMTDGVIATGDLRADICRQAAHKYYGNILLAGERVPFGEHVSTQGMGRAVVQRRKAILPRESKTHIDCGYDGAGEGMVASNEERAKEEMRMAKLEKRKQKNRITAARSNDRKKERMKMQKIELQKLQDRKRELSMKKEQLQTENTMLKTLARSLD